MASDVNRVGQVLQPLDADMIAPSLQYLVRPMEEWLASGGIAAHSVRYARPSHAIPWGKQGCPLLPREVRERRKEVRLPRALEQELGEPLTVDRLDSEVLAGLDVDRLSPSAVGVFRDFLYTLGAPEEQVAIPAGIPLAWFENLPVTGRTLNCVRRAFHETGSDDFLSEPLLAREFLNVRQVGLSTLNELTCVVESAELDWAANSPGEEQESTTSLLPSGGFEAQVTKVALQLIRGMSAFNNNLHEFARWAIAETDAQNFGEAVAQLSKTSTDNELWNGVASFSLTDLAVRPQHPYELLDGWAGELDFRSRHIFLTRVSDSGQNRPTLEALATQFGVSRERIRQIEAKIRRSLDTFLDTDNASPIRWRANTLQEALGVAAPRDAADDLLTGPPSCNDHRGILLEIAGPYDRELDWYTLRSAQTGDPTYRILTQTDDVGRIDPEFAAQQLTEWGLDVLLHRRWLMRDDSVRLFNGQLVRWGSSISDRMAFALADLSTPATVDEMVAHVSEKRSWNSINNAMADDPRLVRVSRTHWALASWALPEYVGVAESMRNLIEERGGSIAVDEMVRCMRERFGIVESTSLAYCDAPMFVVERSILRLRSEDDDPYRSDPYSIRRTPGVFQLGHMRLGRTLRVDADMLRGSGTTLTHAAGAVLEVGVNGSLSFSSEYGDQVLITFPESSLVGPSIGSVRRIAERLSAKEGDYLTLVLDRSAMTVTPYLTDLEDCSPGWEAIGRLTGIDPPFDMRGLAQALRCDVGEVRRVLKARGDDDVLDLLPRSRSSVDLDDALAALEDHIEQVRGRRP